MKKNLRSIAVMAINGTLLGIFLQTLFLGMVMATNLEAQAIKSVREVAISGDFENASIRECFKAIENSTEYTFNYNINDINNTVRIDFKSEGRSVSDLLLEISKKGRLKFRQVNNTINVRQKLESDQERSSIEIIIQGRVITGKVTSSEDNSGLPGVNVIVQGTTTGSVTDIEGNYSVAVPDDNSVLVFSSVGYITEEISVGAQSVIDLAMVPDIKALNEIVVIGYGTKTKGTLTGSTFSVGEEVFESRPQTEVVNQLQGEIPGLLVLRGDGRVGREENNIQIRGITSRSDPGVLIIIDGIPQREANANALNKLNPRDIQDITVLKDAQAAIYGARAAGGVILVTTKKGTSNRPRISYDGNFSWNVPGLRPEITDVREHMIMASEAFENDGNFNHFFVDQTAAVTDPDFDINEGKVMPGPFGDTPTMWLGHNDWMETMWGTALMQNHNLSVSGNSKKSNYFVSFGILDQQSMLQYGENKNLRYFARFKYDFDLIDELLNVGTNISLESQEIKEPENYDRVTGAIASAWTSMPLSTPEGRYYNFGGFTPPHAWAEAGGDRISQFYNTRAQFNATLTPMDGLSVVGRFSAAVDLRDDSALRKIIQFYNWDENPSIRSSDRTGAGSEYWRDTHMVADMFATYNRTFGGKHNTEFTIGASHEEIDNRYFSAGRDFLVSDQLRVLSLGDPEFQFTGESKSQYAISSFFARASYNFDSKYLIEASYRRDGSSRFAKDFRWGDFYGISGGWVLSNESFLANSSFLSNLKIRASFGQLGNQNNVGRFDHFSRINVPSRWGDGNLKGELPFGDPVSPSRTQAANEASPLASENRTWETVNIYNLGIDFAILDSRLSGAVDFFIKNTEDILISQEFPSVLGIAPPTVNGGTIQTKGMEISLTWEDNIGEFNYFVRGLYSDDRNEVTSLEDAILPSFGFNEYVEGYSTGSYFGYEYGGLITDQSVLDEYKTIQGVPGNLRLGDVMWVDKDGDGVLEGGTLYKEGDPESGDLVMLDNNRIRHQFSVTLGANWKGFDFSAMFTGVGRWKVENNDSPLGGNWWEQPWKYEYERTWHEDRPNATWPKMTSNGGIDGWNWTTSAAPFKLWNNAYVRLKNIQIGYTLPREVTDKIKMQNLRIYVSGSNLWEIHNLPKGQDPERPFAFDYSPFPRLLSTGLNITF
ncbi:MAG: TonB-dependent receptor [Cytophagales bacterium]|nr:TonB-dependent receptor [Cytophagales bacterium]